MHRLTKKFKTLMVVLHITDRCNLGCHYCYSKKSNNDMPLDVAYRAVDLAPKLCNFITIVFTGGEPLLVFENIRRIIKYSQHRGIKNFILVTNGVELDNKKVDFFVSNNVAVTISIDGVPEAHNLNRPLPNGKTTWRKVNKALDLFTGYTEIFNKRVPDCFRLLLTFTPETISYLDKSIRYLINKSIGSKAMITLRPAMLPKNRWKILLRDKQMITTLNKQISQIANFYKERFQQGRPFRFCINECLSSGQSNLFQLSNFNKVPFCGAGVKRITISLDGKIFPCWLPAANPTANNSFSMGDVFKGIIRPGVISKFCGSKQNKAFSCLYWNYMENGDPNTPALIYSVLYQGWLKALKKVSKYQKW